MVKGNRIYHSSSTSEFKSRGLLSLYPVSALQFNRSFVFARDITTESLGQFNLPPLALHLGCQLLLGR
jgi:hypothetical protein